MRELCVCGGCTRGGGRVCGELSHSSPASDQLSLTPPWGQEGRPPSPSPSPSPQALGCILYLLCFGQHPFEDGAKLRIVNGKYCIPADDTRYSVFHGLIRKSVCGASEDTPPVAASGLSRPPAVRVACSERRLLLLFVLWPRLLWKLSPPRGQGWAWGPGP